MTKEDEVKKQLKWRLSEKPTVESIEKLINLKIIDEKEAKQLLLDEEEVKPKTLLDLQTEIGLLRELVLDIAKRNPSETIKIIEKHIDHTPYYPWKYQYISPYWTVGSGTITGTVTTGITHATGGGETVITSTLGLSNGQRINLSTLPKNNAVL